MGRGTPEALVERTCGRLYVPDAEHSFHPGRMEVAGGKWGRDPQTLYVLRLQNAPTVLITLRSTKSISVWRPSTMVTRLPID